MKNVTVVLFLNGLYGPLAKLKWLEKKTKKTQIWEHLLCIKHCKCAYIFNLLLADVFNNVLTLQSSTSTAALCQYAIVSGHHRRKLAQPGRTSRDFSVSKKMAQKHIFNFGPKTIDDQNTPVKTVCCDDGRKNYDQHTLLGLASCH